MKFKMDGRTQIILGMAYSTNNDGSYADYTIRSARIFSNIYNIGRAFHLCVVVCAQQDDVCV